jgi:Ni/Fe-hydrogenase subunit HybB-like protein
MLSNPNKNGLLQHKPLFPICLVLVVVGFGTFVFSLMVGQPVRAWQAYLTNFLLWSAIAQGGVLFSVVMHITKARWSGPLSNLAESFTAFFPISFVLFLILFLGKNHIFPWLHEDLHGKEIWLNMPFLFTRDVVGLLVLYGLGFAYLYHALWLKLDRSVTGGRIRERLYKRWDGSISDEKRCRDRMTVFAILYILAFAVILSLIGYDLVMSLDPHWYSTLFGAYTFVKAFYIGLGGLIVLASILHLNPANNFRLNSSDFHDIGKLFFAFCLVWGDFFYVQLLVIWYGNIPEETAYVIERTMTPPWNGLAWFVFSICFILPFLILLNKKIKTKPRFMSILCTLVIMGICLEHVLLIGPALYPHVSALPLGLTDGLIFLGFLGLMALSVLFFLNQFPEFIRVVDEEAV